MESTLQHVHGLLNAKVELFQAFASPWLDRVSPPGSFARLYAGIAAIGLAFWAVEGLLIILCNPLLVRLLSSPVKKGGDAKAQLRKARGAATQTVARLIGSIHNNVQVPLGLLLLLDARFQADRMYATTPLSYAVCYISAGYFLHDLVMCTIRFSLEGPLYLTHALVCHMAYTFGAATGFLHYHGAAFLMWEISTPFVHARWFMYKAGLANSKLYVLNGLAMLSAFFGCRIVWGYVGSYRLVTDVLRERFIEGSLFPLGGTVGYCLIAAIMNTLNTYWFYKMVVAAVHVLIKGKKGAEVGSHKDE